MKDPGLIHLAAKIGTLIAATTDWRPDDSGDSTMTPQPTVQRPGHLGARDLPPDPAIAPVLIRNDDRIDFAWEDRSPAPTLPADHFSVRWTRLRQLEPGWYRFTFRTDDGVRFYVDDELVLDEWHQSWAESYVAEVELPWKPKLVVEYYEGTGDARAHMEMERFK